MSRNKKWVTALAGGLLVVAAAMTAFLVAPQVGQASSQSARMAGMSGMWYGGRGMAGPDNTYLADALGVTPEALAEARQAATEAALKQAVEKGLLTQEQADALQNHERLGGRLGDRMGFPMMRGAFGDIDQEALLANALGINVQTLRDAYTAAAEARVAKAVEDGKLTQEQADTMTAGKNLRQYFQDSGVLTDAMKGALEKAVGAGVITQEQADAMLERMGSGVGGFGRMPGGLRGFGHMPGCAGMRDGGGTPGPEGMRNFRGRGGFDGFGGKSPQDVPMPGVSPDTSGA